MAPTLAYFRSAAPATFQLLKPPCRAGIGNSPDCSSWFGQRRALWARRSRGCAVADRGGPARPRQSREGRDGPTLPAKCTQGQAAFPKCALGEFREGSDAPPLFLRSTNGGTCLVGNQLKQVCFAKGG